MRVAHNRGGVAVLAMIAVLVSILALVISFLAYVHQRRSDQKSRELVVMIEVLRDFRDAQFQEHREYLRTLGAYDTHASQILTDDQMRHVRPLLQYYDNVGMLVKKEVAPEIIVDYLGVPALQAWEKLEPFVKMVQARQGSYMGGFEYLAGRARERHVAYTGKYYFKQEGAAEHADGAHAPAREERAEA